MKKHLAYFFRFGLLFILLAGIVFQPQSTVYALTTLTVTPITWDVLGLDSNNVNVGPSNFPVGARVCNTGSEAATNVTATFVFDDGLNLYTGDPYINLRSGSLSNINGGTLTAGACTDAYFEVSVTRNAGAYNRSRKYHINVIAGNVTGTVSSPTPRQLFVEHLVSQSRNAVDDVKLNGVSYAAGATMSLSLGSTYTIELDAHTATQGYNQLEDFINFPNTIFQVLSVQSRYSADSSTFVSNSSDKLYADACLWDPNPNSATYRSCIGSDGKIGGTLSTIYTIRIIGGVGTTQPLNTLIYDFSGSSYHYNSDYATSARFALITSPLTMTKSFVPPSITSGGTSTLTITVGNTSGAAVSGVSLTDTMPTNVTIQGSATSTCGGISNTTAAITLTNATIPTTGCTITATVTSSTNGTYTNTTANLFINGADTGTNASANLTVTAIVTPSCTPTTIAQWTFTGLTAASALPYAAQAGALAGNTANASANFSNGPGSATIDTAAGSTLPGGSGAPSWQSTWKNAQNLTEYYVFQVNTTNYTGTGSISFSIDKGNNGPTTAYVNVNTTGTAPAAAANPHTITTTWSSITTTFTAGSTIYLFIQAGAGANNGADDTFNVDDVTFTGSPITCTTPSYPTIAKAFSPTTIGAGGTSTLSFTLTNPNAGTALSQVAFTDPLPFGVQVANPPTATITGTGCTGGTFAPTAGDTSLSLTGLTIPLSGSCTVSVNVTAAASGVYNNTTGYISSLETGSNTGAGGSASATLTALKPPSIAKSFSPNPIYSGATSTLTFIITNPNASASLSGIGFSDTFPVGITVSTAPTTPQCGGTVTSTSGSITLAGGTLVAGGTCTVSVVTTASTVGSYANTSLNVSAVISGVTYSGNTASDTLGVQTVHPGISILKQVSTSTLGPWTSNLNVATGQNVYYRFTIENTGDVALSPVSINDTTLNVSSCVWPATLPVGTASVSPTATCIVGPVAAVSGSHSNTATAQGTYSGTVYTSTNSTAVYTTTALTLLKSLTSVSGTGSTATNFGQAGNVITYSYTITNTGAAALALPAVVTDTNTTVACPATDSSGNLDANLDPGENIVCTATYTVTAFDIAVGSVTNVAYATVDSIQSNNTSLIVYENLPDLTVSKTNNTSDVAGLGTQFNWILTIANNGPQAATFSGQTILTDQLPATGATYGTPTAGAFTNITNSGNISCSINGSFLLTCSASAGGVTIGATTGSFTVTIPVTPTASGSLTNALAAVDPNNNVTEGNEGNNNGGDSVSVTNVADLSITKTDGVTTATPGSSVTYTITASNAGPSSVTGATVADTFPGSITATWTCVGAGGGTCTASGSGNITDTVNLPAGASVTYTVTANINAAATGTLTNTATVTAPGSISDPTPGNNSATDTDTLAPSADLAITKTDGSATYTAGNAISYTIVVTNAGPSNATGASVTDTIPAAISGTTVNCVASGTASCGTNASAGNNLSFTGVNIPVGGTNFITITVSGTVNSVTTGNLVNNATVTAGASQTDPTPGNNSSTDTDAPNPQSDLAIIKTDGPATTYVPGVAVIYTVTVTNNGPSDVIGATVTDVKPSQITTWAWACTNQTSGASGCTPAASSSSDFTDTVNIPSGGSIVYTVTANTDSAATGNLVNTATVTAPIGTTDPTPGNNSSTDLDEPTPQSDLAITKTDGVTSVNTGSTTSYTIVVTNNGPSAADGAFFIDPVAPDLTHTSVTCSATNGAACGAATLAAMHTSGIIIPTLPSGGSVTFTVTATVTATSGSVTNAATIDPPAGTTDPNTNDNIDRDIDTVTPVADLSITKTNGVTSLDAGSTTNYTIRVTNNGPSNVSLAILSDPSVTGLNKTNVTCSATPGRCVAPPTVAELESGTFILPDLANGAFYEIIVTADVTLTSVNGSVTNTATVTAPAGTTDPTPGNNTASDTDPVNAVIDMAVTKTDGVTSVNAGGTTTYTIRATNNGPSGASLVVFNDPAVARLTKTAVACSPTPGLCVTPPTIAELEGNTFTLPDMASGQFYEITVTVDVTATSGSVTNTANVYVPSPAYIDPDTSNNTASDTDTINEIADLAITKTDGVATYVPSVAVIYTVTVTNSGPSDVIGATVTDMKPSQVTTWDWACTSQTGGASGCTAVVGSSSDFTDTVDIPSGESIVYTVTANIDIAATGNLVNSATVTAPLGTTDPNLANNTSIDIDTSAANPALSIQKSVTETSYVNVGDVLHYSYLVTNSGNVTLSGPFTVTDDKSIDETCPVTATLAPGVSITCSATYIVTQTDIDAGSVTNIASAQGFFGVTQVNSATDTETVNAIQNPALTIDKVLFSNADEDGSTTVSLNDTLTYTVTVTNTGNTTLTNVQVSDTLITPGTTTCATLAPNATCILTGTYVVTQTDVDNGQIDNTGSVIDDDVCTTACDDPSTVPVSQESNLTITKALFSNADEDNSGTVSLNDTLTYGVTVTNTGTTTLTNVVVSDTLITPSTTTCAILAPNATCVLTGTYVVTQADVDNGQVNNTGRVTDDDVCPNAGTAVCEDPHIQSVSQNPDLTIAKALFSNADEDNSGTVSLNDTLTYTVTVTNTGNTTLTNVVVSDTLITPNTTTCATLAPSATCVLTGTYVVTQAAVNNGQIDNTGSVTDDDVCNPTSCDDPNTVPVPQNPDLTIIKALTGNADEDGSTTVSLNDTLTYTVTVTNTGNTTLTNVVVSDTLITPNNTTCVSLAPNATCVLTGTHVVNQSDVNNGQINNTGSVTDDDVCPNAGAAVCEDPHIQSVPQNPNLTIVKTMSSNADEDNNGIVSLNDTLTYVVTVTNTGNTTLTNVVVSDTLITPGSTTCATLAPNTTCVLTGTYVMTQTDVDNGQIDNTGSVIDDDVCPTAGPTICEDPNTVSIVQVIDPALSKAGNPNQATVGETVTFTITVTNQGNTPAPNVVVTDNLPAIFDVVSVTSVYQAGGNAGVVSVTPGPAPYAVTVNLGTLNMTDVVIITITTTVNSTGNPPISNTASLTSSAGPTDISANNVDSVAITIRTPATTLAAKLPATGFAPNVMTELLTQPLDRMYAATDVMLEIPSLGVKIPIVGVTKVNGTWDVSWLGKQAGWLQGSAFPSWNGNSILTSHVYTSDGLAGPFVNLSKLKFGDQIIVHAYGQKYIFEVQTNQIVSPNDGSAFKHEEKPWLTLITCKEYDERTNSYKKRVVVRAVLVKVVWDK